MAYYTEIYQYFASMVENCCLKTSASCQVRDFTPGPDNKRVVRNKVTGLANIEAKIHSFPYSALKELVTSGQQCPLVTVDSTVRTIYDGLNWERDPRNKGLDEPIVLTAERLRYFVPNAKTIVLLRDPVERIVSDYRFFTGNSSAQRFHDLVVTGIDWWKKCLELLSECQCAFGTEYTHKGLLDLPPTMGWGNNGAARVRIGMYIVFIRRWLEVFPREQLLILNVHEFDRDPIKVLKEKVYAFLELDPMSVKSEQNVRNILAKGYLHETKGHVLEPFNSTLRMLEELYAPYDSELAIFTSDNSFLWERESSKNINEHF